MLQNHPWVQRRNLASDADPRLPSEAVGYLLICLVVRPTLVPDDVKVYLAMRVLGHCTSGGPDVDN